MASQKYILVQASNSPGGLHCINLETGNQLWWFDPQSNFLGLTPAVDQTNGFIYYQTRNRLWKINALNGALLDYVALTNAGSMGSGNTILVNDAHGYFITQCSYDEVAYGGVVRVFDANLDFVWEATGLNLCLKTVMAYNDGVLYVPIGNEWPAAVEWYAGELENAGVKAYDITDGTLLWTYICDPEEIHAGADARGVIDCIYCNGYIVFNTNHNNKEVYILNAADGTLVKKWTGSAGKGDNCAPAVLSGGRIYWGSLEDHKVICVQIGTGDYKNWNTFGSTPQLNHNVAHADSLQTIAETPALVDLIDGGEQGGVIIDSVAYFIEDFNVVKFNPATLVIADNFDIGTPYDSTPLMVKNLADEDVLLVKENANARVVAIDPLTGDRLWNSDAIMNGNLFFGFNYYESTYAQLANGISGASAIVGLNANFAALNSLIAEAATIVSITSAVQWDDINANIASLNAGGVAVAVETITVGMTGTQLNNIINGFVTAYLAANS